MRDQRDQDDRDYYRDDTEYEERGYDEECDIRTDRRGSACRRKKKKRTSPVAAFIFTFLVVILVFLVYLTVSGKGTLGKTVRHKTTEAVVEKAISSAAGTDIDIEEEKSKMTPEDAEKVDDIVDKYGTNENISKAVKAYTSGGGTDAVKAELESEVDPSDVETVKELYEKYGNGK